MNDMNIIFGIVGMLCGFYALRSWYQVRKTGDIKKSVLYPANSSGLVKRCKDKEAYIKETLPKLLILGIMAEIYGAVEVYNAIVMPIKGALIASMVATGAVLLWAGISASKMNKKYF